MDLSKQLEYFDPTALRDEEVHVIGLGAIGSHVCEMLARIGVENIHIYDFDTVEAHNIANQNYFYDDVGVLKVLATKRNCTLINTRINITMHSKGWRPNTRLAGYVFLCVDNIDTRRNIAEENKFNTNIKAMFDFRMGLEDAQHYACDWSTHKNIDAFIETMAFTHDEAKEAMPVSACGTTLSIAPTVKGIVCDGISNWINFVKTNKLNTLIIHNAFKYNYVTM